MEQPSEDKQKAGTFHIPAEIGKRLFVASSGLALLCLALVALTWYRAYNAPPPIEPGEVPITGLEQATNFLNSHITVEPTDKGPFYIPTGIVVQSLEFKGPYTVQVAGYVWQRYSNSLPGNLDRGIVFPESDTTVLTKVYETQQGDELLVGWSFKATLRQQFDYTRYPLDRQQIWVRMWHLDFERQVYLIPDVPSYSSLDVQGKPGLDSGLVLENWDIQRSFFSYRLRTYNSTFGIANYESENPQPELYFNISIRRYILSPLVARGIAPLVILIQLFVIVMVIGSDNKRLEQFGVRPGAVIFTCAAFFFVILVAQNALRDETKWYGVVYLESLHILTYFIILAVAANSVALVALPNAGLFRDNDNLWVAIFYWPLIVFTLWLVTYWTFG